MKEARIYNKIYTFEGAKRKYLCICVVYALCVRAYTPELYKHESVVNRNFKNKIKIKERREK